MALGQSTFSDASAAVSDIFAGIGDQYKAQGAEFEKQAYLSAADLAAQNEKYTEESQAIKQTQLDRQIFFAQSGAQAATAGAGLKESGSAVDLLAQGASQGALTKQVLTRQGLITEEGYKQQEQSYRLLASAADVAEQADKTASIGADIGAAINAAASVATLVAL
jgi:hypothetical protein